MWVVHPLFVLRLACNAWRPAVVPDSGGEFCHVMRPGTRNPRLWGSRVAPWEAQTAGERPRGEGDTLRCRSPDHQLPLMTGVEASRVRRVQTANHATPAMWEDAGCPTSLPC